MTSRIRSTAAPALLAAVALALAQPGPAYANGDPASDVLLTDDVFLPFQPKPSATAATATKVYLRKLKAAGYPLHVAVIASVGDLGDVPEYLGKPQLYADFLYPEIDFQVKGPLLVVMAAGYGTHSVSKKVKKAVEGADPPSGSDRDALPRAAVDVASKMADAAGHPVKPPKLPGGSSSSGSSAIVPILVLLGMVALGAGLAFWKRASAGAEQT
jgi:hypothetical protein